VLQLVEHEGDVLVDGHPLGLRSARRRAQLVAYVPQSPTLPADMTAYEYVLLGRNPYVGHFGTESRHDRAMVVDVLERLDLAPFADRLLGTLSGGERQRIVIARALAQEAPVLLLDEPTSALDIGHQQQALELVDTLRRAHGLTVVSAMHDLTSPASTPTGWRCCTGATAWPTARPLRCCGPKPSGSSTACRSTCITTRTAPWSWFPGGRHRWHSLGTACSTLGRPIVVWSVPPWPSTTPREVADLVERLGNDRSWATDPSRLPGWNFGHVITHLARNADSHRRLIDAAETGRGRPSVPRRAGGTS
jgi:ABC-type lipoprotein export system ATPase subunit